jgi:hypothetical protein
VIVKGLKLKNNYRELFAYTFNEIAKSHDINFIYSRCSYLTTFMLAEFFELPFNEPDNLVELERVSDEVDLLKNQQHINSFVSKSFITSGSYCLKDHNIYFVPEYLIELIGAIIAICLQSDKFIFYLDLGKNFVHEKKTSYEHSIIKLISNQQQFDLNVSALQLISDSKCSFCIQNFAKLTSQPFSFFRVKTD